MENPKAEESIFMYKGIHEKNGEFTEMERLGKTHWQSDYANDIFKSMMEQEQQRRPLQYPSMQLNERKETMQLLQRVTRTFKLSRCALHLAMYYLDRFTDQFKLRADKFPLVGLICLHIAAQIENADISVPRYSEMNHWVKDAYTAAEYKVVERKILCFFNFELIRPTTASFVELLACTFFTRTDFEDYIRMLDAYEREHNVLPYKRFGSFEQMLANLAQLLLRLAHSTLSITSFANVAPSLLAAACIAAVRQVNGVKRWSQYLIDLTTYTEAQVEVYAGTITMYYYYKITPPVAQVLGPEPEKELFVCEYCTGQSNLNWSSPDSGFEEHLNASTGLKEHLNASTDLKEPLTETTDFKEPLTDIGKPLTATTDFVKPLTAGTDFKEPLILTEDIKEPLIVTEDIKEPLTVTKDFVVFNNGTTLETYSIITVQLQEPAPTAVTLYGDPEANHKRRRQEDDIENDVQPYKQAKMVTEPTD